MDLTCFDVLWLTDGSLWPLKEDVFMLCKFEATLVSRQKALAVLVVSYISNKNVS
jgi:hypothetical protein